MATIGERETPGMLHSRTRVIALFALFISCAVLLSGCFHLDSDVKLNGDGSGSYTLTVGVSESFVSLVGDQFVKSMNESGQKVKREGGDYRHFDQDGYSVWAFTRPFKSVSELNANLHDNQSAFTSNLGDSASASSPKPQTLDVSETPGFFVNTFHVTGYISLIDPSTTSPDGSGIDMSSYLKDARESVAITMPGWITSYAKGGDVHGNTVTFTAHYNEEATIDVVGGGVNPTIIYLGVGLGLFILLVIGGIIFWRRRSLRARANESAAVPAPASAADLSPSAEIPDATTPNVPSLPPMPDQTPTP